MKSPRRVRLDFVAPVHRARKTGVALCLAGLATAVSVGVSFNAELTERNRLDAELGGIVQPHRSANEQALLDAELQDLIRRHRATHGRAAG